MAVSVLNRGFNFSGYPSLYGYWKNDVSNTSHYQTSFKSSFQIRPSYRLHVFSRDADLFAGTRSWSDLGLRLPELAPLVLTLWILSLNFASEAHETMHIPQRYACEDIFNYYAQAKSRNGPELMKELNSIISGHQALSYLKVWDALKILDAADVDNPSSSSEVIEIYSLRAVPKFLAGKPDGWNREHLWPRSYGLTNSPSLTDLHNIRPADVNVNSSRGNKYYGECSDISSHACLRPANREAALDTETDTEKWLPPLQFRGDIARSLMYMSVRYGFDPKHGGTPLKLSDSPSTENREMGLLTSLLKWNELDPPSREERLRNDRVCCLYQHNRNPFVDHPEYANLIWKHVSSHNAIISKSLEAWINEFHYNNKGKDKNEFVEIIVGSSTNASDLELVLYNGANGQLYSSSSLSDNKMFQVTNIGSGFSIYTVFLPIQNGPADGIALISKSIENHLQVIQFISYDGTVVAIDGPAKGLASDDLHLRETEDSSEYDSLGLTGTEIEEFKWRRFNGGSTPGKLNSGQILSYQ